MMSRKAQLGGDYDFITSAIGFGTAGIFREPSKSARRRMLESALEAGIRHFDVAPIYGLGLGESELGHVIRRRRDQVVLVTKVGIGLTPLARALGMVQRPVRSILLSRPSLQQRARHSAASPSSGQLGGALYRATFDGKAAQRSLEHSLRALNTEYIDVLLLHDPEPSHLKFEQVHELLERARASGKIRSWGVAGESGPARAVIDLFPSRTPVAQIRDDIFRAGHSVTTPETSDFLITFGVIGSALTTIFEHVTATKERVRYWSDSVGADCANRDIIATFLLKDALRANARGTVLISTTRPERIRSACELSNSDLEKPDASLTAFQQLVAHEMGSGEAAPEDR